MNARPNDQARLTQLGDARAMTNAPGVWGPPEPIMPFEYDA